jgi:two-component system chemotaxis response regulator CheY
MAIDPNIKILIVDDQVTMLRIIRSMLQQLGYNNVEQALDGNAALEELAKGGFGLIISDWNMEGMNGIEFLRAVRAHSTYKTIPFIMVTAENKKENIMEAVQAGVSNYIVKPFNTDTLKSKMEHVFRK